MSDSNYKGDSYQKGVTDMYNAIMRIERTPLSELEKIFGTHYVVNVFKLGPKVIFDKFAEYDKEHSEIKVGDEVIYCGSERKGVVTKVSESDYGSNRIYYRCVRYDGDLSTESSDRPPKKTGRHFSEIEEVLDALKNQ